MRGSELTADVLILGMWSLLFWCLGVTWAIYRAVSWVERMRAWAASVATPSDLSDLAFGSSGETTRGPACGVASSPVTLASRQLAGKGTE